MYVVQGTAVETFSWCNSKKRNWILDMLICIRYINDNFNCHINHLTLKSTCNISRFLFGMSISDSSVLYLFSLSLYFPFKYILKYSLLLGSETNVDHLKAHVMFLAFYLTRLFLYIVFTYTLKYSLFSRSESNVDFHCHVNEWDQYV